MWTRREAVAVAITASATAWTQARARAQALSATRALCPTGKLRAALIVSNPVLVTRHPDGTLGGVSVAVARALAAHLGVPVDLKPYDNPARYNESLATDDWDIGLAARDPSRADHLVFSVTFMEVDNGYVARPGAAPTNAEEVDRPGVKIAVAQGSAPHTVLRRVIKNAEIVPVPGGFEQAREALATGEADVYGENLHLAYRIADELPGARAARTLQRRANGDRGAQAGHFGASHRRRVREPNPLRWHCPEGHYRSWLAGRARPLTSSRDSRRRAQATVACVQQLCPGVAIQRQSTSLVGQDRPNRDGRTTSALPPRATKSLRRIK